jgi:DNA-binding MarR family transcriptional regulator
LVNFFLRKLYKLKYELRYIALEYIFQVIPSEKTKYFFSISLKIKYKMKDNFDIFFRRKPALMLVALKKMSKKRYGSLLAKEVDCTYSHAVKILQTLEELKLVDFEKKGRIKLIKLTKKGEEVAEDIDSIRRRLM